MSIAPEAVQTVGLFSGQHVLAEFDGIDTALLDDEVFLCQILDDALKRAGATVLQVISKQFDPQGVTVLALLSESHASLHTYPENGSVFVDVFTCGTKAQPELAVALLAEAMGAKSAQSRTIRRGLENENEMKVTP
ncbi:MULTISPECIES: adenosylmethionine decarboxylase [unclassified Crossiella]|uniref:adenosylmethionine decarboxylase n=1 Tax=unclassified Crossiella TaxID=2620835 RepID=UPI00207D648B|nr:MULTISPECIES: adenosylmethionine decarboxylase [unclassified Crossiella]MCO1578508.1 adenosylmethionine decarboxylase [Crossiella sp. SN42]WHT22294.1 adenosylmethionine decarboxylase [Crossiella sp. CA-258035]